MTSAVAQDTADQQVFGGVDSHADTIHVAVISDHGGHLADAEFTTTTAGYAAALAFLAAHGHVVAGELAERVHVTTGAMTGILNRLERAGYITRRPDPADRRRVRVAALPDALARTREIYEPYYARITALFADYTPEETAVLHDWFRRANAVAANYLEEHCRTD